MELKHSEAPKHFMNNECKECSFKTIYKENFERHTIQKHSLEEKYFKCEHCLYESFNKSHLKRHYLHIHKVTIATKDIEKK